MARLVASSRRLHRVQHASVMGGRYIILIQTRGGVQPRNRPLRPDSKLMVGSNNIWAGELVVYKKASLRCLLHWGPGHRGTALALVVDRLGV